MNSLEEPARAGFTGLLSDVWDRDDDGNPILEKGRFLPIAHEYSSRLNWTKRCLGFWPGLVVPNLVGVFLYRFAPQPDVPEYHWFVVGHCWPYPVRDEDNVDTSFGERANYDGLPNAYIWTGAPDFECEDASSTPLQALDSYVGVMRDWVKTVRGGKPLHHAFPVDVPIGRSALNYAEIVDARLDRVEAEVLSAPQTLERRNESR